MPASPANFQSAISPEPTPSSRRRRKKSSEYEVTAEGGTGRRTSERLGGGAGGGVGGAKEREDPKDLQRRRYRSFWTRTQSSVLMLGGFVGVVYLGHVPIWILIISLQYLMVRELFALALKAQKHKGALRGFKVLNWHFFCTALLYVYGRFMYKQLLVSLSADAAFIYGRLLASYLVRYHGFICYALYITGFVWFILILQKGQYQVQFGQYAWTHMVLFLVFFHSSFFVYNVFQGIIWFLLPSSLIITNDCAAYLFGFYCGRTPLIKLSPKKTWEGFLGASVTTIVFAYYLAGVMGRYEWLTCPRRWPVSSITLMPIQLHALVFGLFASSIAPFGGFFASGFKRAFKIKDFGDSIPGHGGITDRMDCQMVMAVFAYIYCQSFVVQPNATVEYVLSKAMALDQAQMVELYQRLGSVLLGRGLTQDMLQANMVWP